ncbi:MAG: hypothetical protein Q9201_006656 [Fulgogasparrea decipioides]
MPRRGPALPRLDSSIPPLPPIPTLHTATAPSPATCHPALLSSPVGLSTTNVDGTPPQSGHDYLSLVRDLLTPTQSQCSSPPLSLPSSNNNNIIPRADADAEDANTNIAPSSQIEFFARHPLDRGCLPNAMAFLDASSAGGAEQRLVSPTTTPVDGGDVGSERASIGDDEGKEGR